MGSCCGRCRRGIKAPSQRCTDAAKVTIERWYSPELQTDVMRKEVNPQFGQTTFQLTNIVRAEPGASLFQVSANFHHQESQTLGQPRAEGKN